MNNPISIQNRRAALRAYRLHERCVFTITATNTAHVDIVWFIQRNRNVGEKYPCLDHTNSISVRVKRHACSAVLASLVFIVM